VSGLFHSRKFFLRVNQTITRQNGRNHEAQPIATTCCYETTRQHLWPAIRAGDTLHLARECNRSRGYYICTTLSSYKVPRERDVPNSRRARLSSENCRTYENDDVKAETECCHESLASVLGNCLLESTTNGRNVGKICFTTCSHSRKNSLRPAWKSQLDT